MDLIVDTSRKGVRMFVCGKNSAGQSVEHQLIKLDARGEKMELILDELLQGAGTTLENIKRVLVLCGPGSFTGLRTGIAFCEGLCFSGKRELYGVSTLAALQSFSTCDSPMVITKARPGYWYFSENPFKSKQEFFSSTADVVEAINKSSCCAALLDDSAHANEEIASALAAKNIQVELESDFDDKMNLMTKIFEWGVKPSPVQEANYIQPSYAEQGR